MDETKRLVNGAWDGAVAGHGAISSGTPVGGNDPHNSSSKAPRMFTVEGNGVSSHAEDQCRRKVRATLDDKASLTIVMFVVFLGDTARGIFFPTLWMNVKNMGGDRITLGYCVGAFGLGRVMMSPYFGNLSTKNGNRSVLMVASALLAVGALAYALAWNKEALIVSQIVMGVGSGTLGVTRAYVADKSTPEQRTYLLAYTA